MRINNKFSSNEYDADESIIDTQYFGVRSAKVILNKPCLSTDAQTNLIVFLQDFEFITIINKYNDPYNNHWLGFRTNAFLTDINIQFKKTVPSIEIRPGDNTTLSDCYPYDEKIVTIAENSFKYSRFLNDPYLPRSKAVNIYADIIRNAFEKSGRYIIVCKSTDEVAGFLLFSFHEPTIATIDLVAVDHHNKGAGLGGLLIESLEGYLQGRGIYTIHVGTQLNNSEAISFYMAYGFRIFEANSIYHYWPHKS